MGAASETTVARKRKQVAAIYARQGYRLLSPEASQWPPFLQDCRPDLVAERDDDHVVVAIKPSRALKGSNDLTELAARVTAQPGWRLELFALGGQEPELPSETWLDKMLSSRPAGEDAETFQTLYLIQVLGFLVRGTAIQNGLRVREKSPERIARELAFEGVIDQDTLDRIERAFAWRDDWMQGTMPSHTSRLEAADLDVLCRAIYAQTRSLNPTPVGQ